MCVSPDGRFLLCIDGEGHGLLISLLRRVALHRIFFKVHATHIY